MIRKRKIYIIMGITAFLLFAVLQVNTKGDEQAPWEITLEGEGKNQVFQSSTVMEIYLKNGTRPQDITIFVNQQKMTLSWDYEQSTKIVFGEEGSYKIHIIHKNGYEETRQILIELQNPTTVKISTGSYIPGTWSRQNVTLEAYGAKAISKIHHYEYRTGQKEWKEMKHNKLEIAADFDDVIYVRAVSNAGRQGMICQVYVRVWKKKPRIPVIQCDQTAVDGWYQKLPSFSYDLEQTEGPQTHLYAKLTDLKTKETQTGIDHIPVIRKDGKYQLYIFVRDEAGNESENRYSASCFVDTKEPEIYVEYEKQTAKVMKYQKAKIRVRDENLKKSEVRIKTSGKQIKPWKQEGGYYKTEIIFQKDGDQTLVVDAQDMAGNKVSKEETSFQVDTKEPKIEITGIKNGKSYRKPVKIQVHVQDAHADHKKTKIFINGKEMRSSTITKDGYYTIKAQAQDLAGNQNVIKKRFMVNQKGIQIHFLQQHLEGKEISAKNLKPGFRIESMEPVQVTAFLVNGQKRTYQWKGDEVYLKEPISENGKYIVKLSTKDTAGNEKTSRETKFIYDTKKPEIQIKGLDKNAQCAYGKEIRISLENKKDQWKKVVLDGENQKNIPNTMVFQNLEPGDHELYLEAADKAGNQTIKKIKFKVTKVLPPTVKKIMTKTEKNLSKEDKKKEKSSNSTLMILAGGAIAFFLIGIVRKYSKYKHS